LTSHYLHPCLEVRKYGILFSVCSFGNKHVTPRSLISKYLGNMVCVEGIVTKCSLIHPKIVRSVHYCPTTKKTMERRYTDMTSLEARPSSGVYPTKVCLFRSTVHTSYKKFTSKKTRL
jgi:DNA replicative helicase MCM subunit Mcm2 (Cdc46/Mcm family)